MHRTLSKSLAVLGVTTCSLALVACSGTRGKHTSEHLATAQERMGSLKAATSWDLARQQFLVGDLPKALRNVDESLGHNPSVPKSHTLKGRILIELGQMEQAIESFRRALAIDPSFDEGHYYLGISFERVSEFDRALVAYEAAANLDPTNAQYAIAAAEMYIELDHLDRAEQLLASRKAMFEHNSGVRQTLGHIAMLRGDAKQAVVNFREARLLAPDDITVLEDLALAQVAAKDWVEAEYSMRTLLADKDYKTRRDLKRIHARTLAGIDRPVEARAILLGLTSEADGANDWQAWLDLANVALSLRDDNRARLSARRAIALVPERPEGYAILGTVFFRAGDLNEALAQLDKAVERSHVDPTPALMRGVVLEKLGRFDEAEDSYARALELAPEDARAQRMLASVMDIDDED